MFWYAHFNPQSVAPRRPTARDDAAPTTTRPFGVSSSATRYPPASSPPSTKSTAPPDAPSGSSPSLPRSSAPISDARAPWQVRPTSEHPAGEVVAGCADPPQSISHGLGPSARDNAVIRQRSSSPDGVRRRIVPIRPGWRPSSCIVAASSSMLAPRAASGWTAKAMMRPCVLSSSSENGRGAAGVGWAGSAAMTSRYALSPSERRALCVPTPGWLPPAAGRTPVRRSMASAPSERSAQV
mmetsp:Transcript_8966/g.28833  ORF Transcript_8966/g.28833 Transcript_8966/m.28833 type:complete len:239 (-) Transcript_8966:515-1231(-)